MPVRWSLRACLSGGSVVPAEGIEPKVRAGEMCSVEGRSLIIAYGNPSRRDDGVGFHVLNALREELGRKPLSVEDDGADELGMPIDTLCLHQLAPELAETVAEYDVVVFVDAHVPGAYPEPIREEAVGTECSLGPVTHHMKPEMIMAVTRALFGRAPDGWLVSVKGHDFDFGVELSDRTAALVPEAAGRVRARVVA